MPLKRSILPLLLYTAFFSQDIVAEKPAHKRDPERRSIPLELTTDAAPRSIFSRGETVQFLLSLGDAAFIYMFIVDPSGNIQTVLPSAEQAGHYYEKGFFMTLPEYGGNFRFIAGDNIGRHGGEQIIWLMASDVSVPIRDSLISITDIRHHIVDASKQKYAEYRYSLMVR